MRRLYTPYILCPLAVALVCSSVTWPQNTQSERESVLSSLAVLFGEPINKRKMLFAVTRDYVLSPAFSGGLLVAISIEPKPNADSKDTSRSVQLSKPEFDSLFANLNSIKSLGPLEEEFGAKFVHGGKAFGWQRYRNAYLHTAELIYDAPPRPLVSAHVYYLHPVTEIAKISRVSKPKEAVSFGLLYWRDAVHSS